MSQEERICNEIREKNLKVLGPPSTKKLFRNMVKAKAHPPMGPRVKGLVIAPNLVQKIERQMALPDIIPAGVKNALHSFNNCIKKVCLSNTHCAEMWDDLINDEKPNVVPITEFAIRTYNMVAFDSGLRSSFVWSKALVRWSRDIQEDQKENLLKFLTLEEKRAELEPDQAPPFQLENVFTQSLSHSAKMVSLAAFLFLLRKSEWNIISASRLVKKGLKFQLDLFNQVKLKNAKQKRFLIYHCVCGKHNGKWSIFCVCRVYNFLNNKNLCPQGKFRDCDMKEVENLNNRTHTFRVGAACLLLQNGCSHAAVRWAGRWASDSMVERYSKRIQLVDERLQGLQWISLSEST